MAERLNSENATSGHNSKSKLTVIRESMERLYRLDAEIDELIEEHIKELREQKTEIKTKLREEFNMPAKLIQARYASYRLERAAEESHDNQTLEAIREMFRALPIGGQGDFMNALSEDDVETGAEVGDDGPEVPNEKQSNAIRLDGAAAAEQGKKRRSGYSVGSRADDDWKTGYDERKDHLAKDVETDLGDQAPAGTA
jgi:cysteinyl-tRNA synthetase